MEISPYPSATRNEHNPLCNLANSTTSQVITMHFTTLLLCLMALLLGSAFAAHPFGS